MSLYGGDFYEHWTYGMPGAHHRQSRGRLLHPPACGASWYQAHRRSWLQRHRHHAGPPARGIAEGLVESQDIVADLVVGYSGAGKESQSAPTCLPPRPR